MESIRFRTSDGLTLEGELRRPTTLASASAIICHPHPLQGGSKDHPILWAIRNDLAHRRFVVLGFNFRGVMGSEGDFGGGVSETLDARAALDRIREEVDGPSVVTGVVKLPWPVCPCLLSPKQSISPSRVPALPLPNEWS